MCGVTKAPSGVLQTAVHHAVAAPDRVPTGVSSVRTGSGERVTYALVRSFTTVTYHNNSLIMVLGIGCVYSEFIKGINAMVELLFVTSLLCSFVPSFM